jgi:hypothetical protein
MEHINATEDIYNAKDNSRMSCLQYDVMLRDK